MDNEDELNKAQSASLDPKKITFSNSFEEAEEKQIRYWAALTPEQRFCHFRELMNRFKDFSKPNWTGMKVNIDK